MRQRLISVRAAVIYHRNSIEMSTGSDPRA
jgi:hypothetical protein